MSESKELVERLRNERPMTTTQVLANYIRAADLIERQAAIIEALAELFVDTTTVENPEQERVVIEARALTKQ